MARQKQKKGSRTGNVEVAVRPYIELDVNEENFFGSLNKLGYNINDFSEEEKLQMVLNSISFVEFNETQVRELLKSIGR